MKKSATKAEIQNVIKAAQELLNKQNCSESNSYNSERNVPYKDKKLLDKQNYSESISHNSKANTNDLKQLIEELEMLL